MTNLNSNLNRLKRPAIRGLKTVFSIIVAAALLPQAVFADVLGTHISSESSKIAPETVYTKNVFDDSSVGKQTENYVEYKPNAVVHPAVTNGWSAYGKRTVSQAAEILKQQGHNPAMGMNADFFSFQTGVPMSNTLIDGRIYTADSSWMPGIGFRSDGTAFTATFPINTMATLDDGSSFKIECINKYRQPYALYLFNSDFGDSTHSPDKGTDIVLGSVSGSFRIGGEVCVLNIKRYIHSVRYNEKLIRLIFYFFQHINISYHYPLSFLHTQILFIFSIFVKPFVPLLCRAVSGERL